MPYPPYDPREDITDTLLKQQGAGPLSYGMAGLGSAAPAASPMTGPTLPGWPATPAGGVPGAGIGPTGPSVVQMPPQKMGLMGAMPGLGSLGAMRGIGQMSDFESAVGGGRMRRRGY